MQVPIIDSKYLCVELRMYDINDCVNFLCGKLVTTLAIATYIRTIHNRKVPIYRRSSVIVFWDNYYNKGLKSWESFCALLASWFAIVSIYVSIPHKLTA